jgi:hypothetical protein
LMPRIGHNGRQVYLPSEAYDVVGHKLYGQDRPRYIAGPLLLHPQHLATQAIENNDVAALEVQDDLNDPSYQARQSRSYRSARVLSHMIEALQWGKARAWLADDIGNWRETVPPREWEADSEAARLLKQDLISWYAENEPESDRLHIDRAEWNKWFLGDENASLPARVVEKPRRSSRGRPGIALSWCYDRLNAWEQAGEIDCSAFGWRVAVCGRLIKEYAYEKPGWKGMKKTSLRDQLKERLDEIENRWLARAGKTAGKLSSGHD